MKLTRVSLTKGCYSIFYSLPPPLLFIPYEKLGYELRTITDRPYLKISDILKENTLKFLTIYIVNNVCLYVNSRISIWV